MPPKPSELTIDADDEAGTARIAAAIAAALPDRAVVALEGELGAGKTFFVRCLAEAYGVDPREVVSPTFVLLHVYTGRRTIYHFDVYRLASADEFLDLGPEEYFASPGICVVEWGDRVQGRLPAERLDVRIEITGPTARRFSIRAHGSEHIRVLRGLSRLGPARAPLDEWTPPPVT